MSSRTVTYDTTSLEFLAFNGNNHEDVTLFIRDVKRIAMTHNRQRDADWLMDYVETCLGGNAMRWFVKLDKDAMKSWDTLRDALLQRFGSPPPQYIPAATPIKSEMAMRVKGVESAPMMSAVPVQDTGVVTARGRIRVHREGYRTREDIYCGLECVNLNERSGFSLCETNAMSALIFEFISGGARRSRLRVLNGTHDRVPVPVYLCLVQGRPDSTYYSLDFCVENPETRRMECAWPPYRTHPVAKNVWSYVGGQLSISCTSQSGETFGLRTARHGAAGGLYLFDEDDQEWGLHFEAVSLYFEPI
ncbi:hypothetical protein FRB95_001657 [Tulasnella sp. JGI-2019a]|nr:hypothetical protein FRB95_001657 [Tulasnella sp. JGI-2019a]